MNIFHLTPHIIRIRGKRLRLGGVQSVAFEWIPFFVTFRADRIFGRGYVVCPCIVPVPSKPVKETTEEDLIRRISEGDEQAFKLVFDHYYRPLTVFSMKYVSDVEDAREIVQEFFVRMWQRRGTLQIRFSLRMYLYQSVRNASLNFIASAKVEKRRLKDYAQPDVENDNVLDHMMAAEQEELLMKAIDNLPEKCRQIFVLSRMSRLSNQAIATQLSISIKTVEGQISIALKRLAEWLIALALIVME